MNGEDLSVGAGDDDFSHDIVLDLVSDFGRGEFGVRDGNLYFNFGKLGAVGRDLGKTFFCRRGSILLGIRGAFFAVLEKAFHGEITAVC